MSFNLKQLYEEDYSISQEEMDVLRNQAIVDEEKRNYVESNLNRLQSKIDEANGRGEPILPHIVVDMIIRRLFKGEKPSDIIQDGQQPIPNQPVKVRKVKRNDEGIILSYEDTNKRLSRYEEIDLMRIDYKTEIFNHVINTKFEEFTQQVEDETNNFKQLLTKMNDEILLLKATLDGMNSSLNNSELEKSRLQNALSIANKQLGSLSDQMTKQQQESQERLNDVEKNSSKAIKDMIDKLMGEINKKQSDIDKLKDNVNNLQDKISDANKKADEAVKKANEKKKEEETKKTNINKNDVLDKNPVQTNDDKSISDVLTNDDLQDFKSSGVNKSKKIIEDIKKKLDKKDLVNVATYDTTNTTSNQLTSISNMKFDGISSVSKILDKQQTSKPDPNYIKKTKIQSDIKMYEDYVNEYSETLENYKDLLNQIQKDIDKLTVTINGKKMVAKDKLNDYKDSVRSREEIIAIIKAIQEQLDETNKKIENLKQELKKLN